MDDLGAMLGQFLNSQEGQEQLKAVASALGMQTSGAASAAPAPAPAPASAPASGGQIDLASLIGSLQTQPQQAPVPTPPVPQSVGGIDLSQLNQLLSGLNAPAQPQSQTQQAGGLNLGALAGLLGGQGGTAQPSQQAAGGPLPGLDMGAIAGLQQAFSAFGQDRNVALLLALKPALSPERQKKTDDAVRILQLLRLWPLVKETGLFGDMSRLGGGDRR